MKGTSVPADRRFNLLTSSRAGQSREWPKSRNLAFRELKDEFIVKYECVHARSTNLSKKHSHNEKEILQ